MSSAEFQEGLSALIEKRRPDYARADEATRDNREKHRTRFTGFDEKVLSLYSGYRVYLRHYTEGVEETVMYFV